LVYQVGDNYQFHRGCLEWLPRLPGIVCLHDFFLGHLFDGWAQEHRREADATLHVWYGEEAARCFFRYPDSELFIKGKQDVAPMTEWICSMAHGVVTHSSWGIKRVLNSCPGPVYVAPLAYDAPKIKSIDANTYYSESNQFTILTIGHINPNKRVASVIRAIGNSPLLRQRSIYRLVGNIQPEAVHELSALARKCQVNLVISGEVDEANLAHAIEQAEVVSCLRWPSLEAASASAIEAMLYGKPTIVTDTGFYRELPDTCVKKIDPENEISSLQLTLEQLLVDSQARYALGAAAKTWAEATFTPENYAQKLIDIGFSTNKAKPMIAAANYFTEIMKRWEATEELINLENTIAPLRLFKK
jgi:glycosyltransferase involved in cell wall biosynthesis